MSEALRAGRLDRGLTLQQVADYVGVSRQSVHLWETGANKPRHSILDEVCVLYRLDYDTINSLRNKG